MVIKLAGELYRVVSSDHITPGNWRGFVQTKLRSLKSGKLSDQRFRSTDTVEKAVLSAVEMEYLYSSGDDHHFMNTETYEQITLTSEALGDGLSYLIPNIKIQVDFFEDKPVGIELPGTVELKVVDCEPAIKGASAAAQTKSATLETGLTIQVPYFVQSGEVVRVETSEGKYVERVK
jgi:elongation factor P